MANNPPEVYAADDFLEKILAILSYASLPVTDISAGASSENLASGISQLQQQPLFPLGLSLGNGFADASNTGGFQVKTEREAMNMGNLYPGLEHLQSHAVCLSVPQVHQVQPFQCHPTSSTTVTIPHQPAIRPRFRARRGQATDPHSIAERFRRERISERIKALQELVPSCNKVLSMSRLGGASVVAQLVADIPLQSVEGDSCESRSNQHVWEKWSDSETEQEVAKLMEEDVGTAMQYL
ncbi:hypothetical protein AABB24_025524 [Solanum stoloniferum]|uniref:BHLH domain-containing protein n=1 Tax=Solanum stoloniferum TaxID=62892 RepID=A0ABD2SBR8_9SOLN